MHKTVSSHQPVCTSIHLPAAHKRKTSGSARVKATLQQVGHFSHTVSHQSAPGAKQEVVELRRIHGGSSQRIS